ncbi:MAG: radical SAM protein [Desulfomonilia bacterium]|nr:radical SAM protein [Desulfomonilia bacterium]
MRCSYCEWRCEIDGSTFGVCRMYHVVHGEIRERFPNRWSTYAMSRMESLPFYHVYPGSRVMTIGTFGCNFSCRYCSNGFIALRDPAEQRAGMYELTPEELVRMALKLECHAIVFNVNEPAVSLPSLQELKVHADKAGLALGCLTNAYTTVEATHMLAEIFSFINIGLKGFTKEFHKKYIGVTDVEPILRNIRALAAVRHVEVTTPIVQDVNEADIPLIADFLAGIDREIPWHAFRLLPEHEMKDSAYPNIEAVNQALDHARSRLDYVYFHNFVGSEWVNSACPGCGRVVIERISLGCGGDRLDSFHCIGNRCPGCGYAIRMHGALVERFHKEAPR